MAYTTEWDGDNLLRKTDRAIGRAAIGIGERVSVRAKEIVHVQSGTLRRSLHTAKAGDFHGDDEQLAHGAGPRPPRHPGVYTSGVPGSTAGLDLAEARDHLLSWEEVEHSHVAVVEVGSWIAYACVEETGRQHHYILPAVDEVVPTGWETIEQAFREEGL